MDYPIKNCACYLDGLSGVVKNFQRMFGINVEVYRIDDRASNKYVKAYGSVNAVAGRFSSKIFDIHLICSPHELHNAYLILGGEISVYTKDNVLKSGDIIKYQWLDKTILEFEVIEQPKTYGGVYYEYKLKSMYQTNSVNG